VVVVVPVDERARHALNSKYCPCNPRAREGDGYDWITHQAFDHREVDEYYLARRRGTH
jgi:hypothetical protein